SYGKYTGKGAPFYEAAPEVVETVNLAIKLGRPILVEGEAGCGKTKLASAIAHELDLGHPISITVKSTSHARDLLYKFDALRRLQDVQNPTNLEARYIYPYIFLQPFGSAISNGKPCVVLIDEIDKADIDFPNDLLEVVDQFFFDIEDLPEAESALCLKHKGFGRRVEVSRSDRPIVVVTSNREKQLPEPFLRRCLYIFWLSFPKDSEILKSIVKKNLDASLDHVSEELISEAVRRFLDVRYESEKLGAQKKPATSELIDWVNALHWQGKTGQEVGAGGLRPVYWRLLFKTMQDLDVYDRHTQDIDASNADRNG
ncbi:MAG TPA: MoxR family ATPase, partial [Ktedonobacteraceae bacterium]|nr:MoxR family ATPase [Ktedonobacteraceae bacterium]